MSNLFEFLRDVCEEGILRQMPVMEGKLNGRLSSLLFLLLELRTSHSTWSILRVSWNITHMHLYHYFSLL
jgi:hypothetical protein